MDDCFTMTIERLTENFAVNWYRTCEIIVNLVPFSALDGMFLTNEGYTILVKI